MFVPNFTIRKYFLFFYIWFIHFNWFYILRNFTMFSQSEATFIFFIFYLHFPSTYISYWQIYAYRKCGFSFVSFVYLPNRGHSAYPNRACAIQLVWVLWLKLYSSVNFNAQSHYNRCYNFTVHTGYKDVATTLQLLSVYTIFYLSTITRRFHYVDPFVWFFWLLISD